MITGFSCEEEYDYYMQGQAEAEAQAQEAEAMAIIEDAFGILFNMGFTPEDYKKEYEKQKERGEC